MQGIAVTNEGQALGKLWPSRVLAAGFVLMWGRKTKSSPKQGTKLIAVSH
jgi:hypothetical protein